MKTISPIQLAKMMDASEVEVNVTIQLILREYKNEVLAILGPNLHGIVLFGSQARGDARLESDIDVLVLLNEKNTYLPEIQEQISHASFSILLKYEKLISTVVTTVETFQQMQEPLYQNIQQEGFWI